MMCKMCLGPLRPLFTSMFCPNGCDSKPRSFMADNGELWCVQLRSSGGKIPLKVTHGYWTFQARSVILGLPDALQLNHLRDDDLRALLRYAWTLRSFPKEFKLQQDGIIHTGGGDGGGVARPLLFFWKQKDG